MKTNLELAAELIAAEVNRLNNLKEHCSYPKFNRLDEIEYDKLFQMVYELSIIIHRRQERQKQEEKND